ncbi:hypothetical protein CHUAL_008127, partial [Chamberlinius hualienensis]
MCEAELVLFDRYNNADHAGNGASCITSKFNCNYHIAINIQTYYIILQSLVIKFCFYLTMNESSDRKPVEKEYRSPGLRNAQTTNLFRVMNFELFVKPNKYVMAMGITAISLCVGYLAYLNVQKDNKAVYEGINEDGSKVLRT